MVKTLTILPRARGLARLGNLTDSKTSTLDNTPSTPHSHALILIPGAGADVAFDDHVFDRHVWVQMLLLVLLGVLFQYLRSFFLLLLLLH